MSARLESAQLARAACAIIGSLCFAACGGGAQTEGGRSESASGSASASSPGESGDRGEGAGASTPSPRSDVFVARYGPGPAWVSGRPLAEQEISSHVTFAQAQAGAHRFVAGGPISDSHGVYIVRSSSRADVETLLATDPGVTSGVLRVESISGWGVMAGALVGPPADSEEWFFLDYRPGPSWAEGRPMSEQPLGEHFAYVMEGVREGVVLLAGPMTGEDRGLYLVGADDREAVTAGVAQDPAVRDGLLVADITRWHVLFAQPL